MDANNLTKLIGKSHTEEVKALMQENDSLSKVSLKNPIVTLILSIFLGIIGIDRLYQGGIKIFLCKLAMVLLTLGTWWIVDIGYSIKVTQEVNYNKIIAAA